MNEKVYIVLSEADAQNIRVVIKDVVEDSEYTVGIISSLIHLNDEIIKDLARNQAKEQEANNAADNS